MQAWVQFSEKEDGCVQHFVGMPDDIGIPDPSKVSRGFRLTRDWQYFPRVSASQGIAYSTHVRQHNMCYIIDRGFRILQWIAANQQAERDEFNTEYGIIET
jgi:hypothetical protein